MHVEGGPVTSDTPEGPMSAIDTFVPHNARIWNHRLGGEDDHPVDREMGERIRAFFPEVVDNTVADRAFLTRAVTCPAGEEGVDQFLDIDSGLERERHPQAHRPHGGADHRPVRGTGAAGTGCGLLLAVAPRTLRRREAPGVRVRRSGSQALNPSVSAGTVGLSPPSPAQEGGNVAWTIKGPPAWSRGRPRASVTSGTGT